LLAVPHDRAFRLSPAPLQRGAPLDIEVHIRRIEDLKLDFIMTPCLVGG